MSSFPTYVCDICGCKVVPTYKQDCPTKELMTISFSVNNPRNIYDIEYSNRYDLCPKCIEKLGIKKKQNINDKPTPTIESRLYDIMCEIIQTQIPPQQG